MVTSSKQSHDNTQDASDNSPVDLRVVYLIIGALALLAPSFVWANPDDNMVTVMAMTWSFSRVGGKIFWLFMDPILIFAPLPFTVWRPVFVYQMARYYQGRGTRIGTILLGIFAELPFLLLNFIFTVFSPPTMHLWDPGITFPTPFMLLAGLGFMWMKPYPFPKTPFDDQAEPDKWWPEESEFPVGQLIELQGRKYLTHARSRLRCPRCGSGEIGLEMYPGSFGIRARFVYSCRRCKTQWEG
jgi:hypothetical protein